MAEGLHHDLNLLLHVHVAFGVSLQPVHVCPLTTERKWLFHRFLHSPLVNIEAFTPPLKHTYLACFSSISSILCFRK